MENPSALRTRFTQCLPALMREGEGENWEAVQLWRSGLRGSVGTREGQKMGFPRVAL